MIRRIAWIILTLLLSGCGEQRAGLPTYELTGQTMGTSFSITLVAANDDLDRASLEQQVVAVLARIDQRMSTWRTDSELSIFNTRASTDWASVSREFCEVIEAALELSERTGGAFDITVGPLVNLWGFGPVDNDRKTLPSEEQIAATLQRVGYLNLQTDCEVPAVRKSRADIYVDLSAIAKGYAVDQLADLLDEQQQENYLVEIGGEIRMRGRNATKQNWAVAIEKPADHERAVQTVIRLTGQAMATSGDYRNFFEAGGQRYSHTIDSRTGRPVTHNVAAVTVIAANAAIADGLATALLVLGPDEGFAFAEREEIAAYFLLRDGTEIIEKASAAFRELPNQ
jgi:thiamine biosynthesis lipoprotein